MIFTAGVTTFGTTTAAKVAVQVVAAVGITVVVAETDDAGV
jgi:hypothetical protein